MREVVGHHCGIDEGLRLMLEVQYQIPAIFGIVKLEDCGMYENHVTLEQWNSLLRGCFYIY
jgi:hypothetical protein